MGRRRGLLGREGRPQHVRGLRGRLPEDAAVLYDLARAAYASGKVAEAERTGDVAPVRHLLDSLLVTARLQGNAAYLRAVEEADTAEARGDEAPEDVGEFVARMRATYGG